MENEQTYYHIRITTTLDVGPVEFMVKQFAHKYILGKEQANNQHYHCIYLTNKSREQIKKILNDHKLKGNKSFSITEVRDELATHRYVCKEHDIVSLGYSPEEIDNYIKGSYKKDGLKEAIEENENRYYENPHFETFVVRHIQILAEHGKNINNNQIKAYCNKVRVKQEPLYAHQLYNQIFYN